MQGRSASLVVSIAFSGLPRLLIGLTCLWSIPGGIYMVTNFLVNSVLAEIYFLLYIHKILGLYVITRNNAKRQPVLYTYT